MRLAKVPTLVKLDPVTVAFNVDPVSVLASAVTVIGALPSKAVPLMALGVARVVAVVASVAVAALPEVDPELPVTLPTMGLVTVRSVKVPTLVKLDPVTVAFNVDPVSVLASAVTVIGALPSKAVPLMALGVARVVAVVARVAVAALPEVDPELPVTLPEIGLVTVRSVKVPTLVKLDPVTVAFNVDPVSVLASAVTVIGALPSKAVPLMALGVARVVAVVARVAVAALPEVDPELPVTLPAIGLVTVRLAKVPTLVKLDPVTVAFNVDPVSVLRSCRHGDWSTTVKGCPINGSWGSEGSCGCS